MENRILNLLEFNFKYSSPLTFLERFLRLYGLDPIFKDKEKDSDLMEIRMLMQAIVRYVLRDCYSLQIGNSYWAAFSLILAINIGCGPVGPLINFE